MEETQKYLLAKHVKEPEQKCDTIVPKSTLILRTSLLCTQSRTIRSPCWTSRGKLPEWLRSGLHFLLPALVPTENGADDSKQDQRTVAKIS